MEQPTDAPAVEQDQPTVEQPPAETPAAEETFAQNFDPAALPDELRPAYRQLQGDYTRKTQEVAAQRKQAEQAMNLLSALGDENNRADAVAQLAERIGGVDVLLDALGFTLDDDSDTEFVAADDDVPDHTDEFRDPRLDPLLEQIEQAQRQQAEQARLAAVEKHFSDQFAEFSQIEGRDLTEEEQTIVVASALATPPGEDGLPNARAAYEQLMAVRDAWQKQWLESKKAPQVAAQGEAGTPSVDWRNRDERIKRMAALLSADDA